jgi:hypothetical protein
MTSKYRLTNIKIYIYLSKKIRIIIAFLIKFSDQSIHVET